MRYVVKDIIGPDKEMWEKVHIKEEDMTLGLRTNMLRK